MHPYLLQLCLVPIFVALLHAEARFEVKAARPSRALVDRHAPAAPAKEAIVLSRFKEDVSWLVLYLPHTAHYVYQIGDASEYAYGTANNTCGESIVYLTFILDHYDALPEAVLFAHAHRQVVAGLAGHTLLLSGHS